MICYDVSLILVGTTSGGGGGQPTTLGRLHYAELGHCVTYIWTRYIHLFTLDNQTPPPSFVLYAMKVFVGGAVRNLLAKDTINVRIYYPLMWQGSETEEKVAAGQVALSIVILRSNPRHHNQVLGQLRAKV